MQPAHNLYIKRLERVACRLDEVDASVYTVVNNVHPVELVLSIKIGVEALLDVLNNRSPRVIVVNEVAKAGCVNHRKP